MAHAMRAIAHLRAIRGPGALSIPPSVTAERARTTPAAIRTFSLAHSRASHTAFTSPASSTPLRPGTRLLQHRLNVAPQPQNRYFSIVSYFDTAINTTQDYLLFLHTSLGIPWYLTIPLFAISLNMLLRLPSRLYTHGIIQRRAKLDALNHVFMHLDVSTRDRGKNYKLDENLKIVPELAYKSHTRFEERWKLQTWRVFAANLACFPLWLLGIEAIRRQSMATDGLLGLILDWFREKKTIGEVDPVELANSALKRPLGDGPVLDNTLNEAISHAAGQATQDIASTAVTTTAAPAMEGILWIPDLALADPYHILPLTLSAVLVATMSPKDGDQWRVLLGTKPIEDHGFAPKAARSKRRLMITGMRMNLLFSILVGPVTSGLPAAMHLYWIVTTLVTPVLRRVMSMLWPVREFNILRTRPEAHMMYPMPQEWKQQPVAESTAAARSASTAAASPTAAIRKTTSSVKPASAAPPPPPTKPASTPAKPASRFAAQGSKKEKTAKR